MMKSDKVGASEQFELSNTDAYHHWRQGKLNSYPASVKNLVVTINDFNLLRDNEVEQIHKCLDKFNMVVYSLNTPRPITTRELQEFAAKFGLNNIDGNLCSNEDNISTVTVVNEGRHKGYIPYTNKPISWHTDGYYNLPEQTVRSFVLHCLEPAISGGENNLLDPEIIYILLRDENPEFITALMADDVMTIPENVENGIKIRDAQTGPVFSVNSDTGKLHCRYTARTRNIEWKDTAIVKQAVLAIKNCLQNETKYIFNYKLKAGQGLLCNNVLHNRTAFEDDDASKRILLRARYYDRILKEIKLCCG